MGIGALLWVLQLGLLMALVASQGTLESSALDKNKQKNNIWKMGSSPSNDKRGRWAPNTSSAGKRAQMVFKPSKYRTKPNTLVTDSKHDASNGKKSMMWKGKNTMTHTPWRNKMKTKKYRQRLSRKDKDVVDNVGPLWHEGVSITPSPSTPIPDPVLTADYIAADFSSATAQNPSVLFHVVPQHSVIEVEIFLPLLAQDIEIYSIQGRNVEIGSACSFEDAIFVPTLGFSSARLFLSDGVDTIVAVCDQNVVIAQSYFLFQSPDDTPEETGRQLYRDAFPDSLFQVIDFSHASPENPVVDYFFVSSSNQGVPKTPQSVVLYGSSTKGDAATVERQNPPEQGSVHSFYTLPLVGEQELHIGDPCPAQLSQKLSAHQVYPLTVLFLVPTLSQHQTVYACGNNSNDDDDDSTVVGIVDFAFVV